MTYIEIPDELTWLEIIGIEPSDASPQDGYWSYDLIRSNTMHLRLSFNIFERSLQTELKLVDQLTQTVCQEGLVSLRCTAMGRQREIQGECHVDGAMTTLRIRLDPPVEISWSTLRQP